MLYDRGSFRSEYVYGRKVPNFPLKESLAQARTADNVPDTRGEHAPWLPLSSLSGVDIRCSHAQFQPRRTANPIHF